MKYFRRALTFDFGSSNTRVCDEKGRIVFDEPTIIASYYGPNEPILIGDQALILSQTEFCKSTRPIVNGYVGDYDAFEIYAKRVVRKILIFPRLRLKTVLIAIPNDLVGDENASACDRAFFEPFRKVGVKNFKTIHKSYAAYLDINK